MSRRTPVRGKVVLVTGSASGIGAATARELAQRGARLALLDRETAALSALADQLGDDTLWCTADVTDQRSLEAAVRRTVERFGTIDVVIANAGVTTHGTIHVTDSDAFARTVDVNLVGVHRTVSAALPHLVAARGYVLVVGSLASFVSLPGAGGYSPSKAGVESLAGALSAELASAGIAVGCAHPCWIDTPMVQAAESQLPTFRDLRAKLPWPARSTTTPEHCGVAFADAIERRARKVYVPRTTALIAGMRSVLMSGVGHRMALRTVAPVMPQLDREVLAHREASVVHTSAGDAT